MKFVAIIPARYASTRFPGKPLALLNGKTIIQHVYQRAKQALEAVYVATDDERIAQHVRSFGGKVVMTSTTHSSGTDRCQEAYTYIQEKEGNFDVVVNVQGDEPFIAQQQIQALMACFEEPQTDIATLIKPFEATDDFSALANPNTPKVVIDIQGYALYFSRSIIPFLRNVEQSQWLQQNTFYKHIGIYAYRTEALQRITQLPVSPLEAAESLEQLRWLEAGLHIKTSITEVETIGIDTLEDLIKAEAYLQNKH